MNTDIRKNYHGCQNCVHQPEPLRTCDRILDKLLERISANGVVIKGNDLWKPKEGGNHDEN